MSVPIIEVHDLTVAYGEKPVLWDIDLSFPHGALIAIVGPNGAGKSTLLKSILGLLNASSGSVTIFQQPASTVRQRIAYVPQRESIDWEFPVSVLDVVLMGRYGKIGWFRRSSRHDREFARHCLDQVGMAPFAARHISQLSGGQQQRVFLARALAQEAELYLMDEPFAGVDAATERSIVELLRALRNQGKTVVAVHHDLQTIPEYFDWVALLNLRLVAAGPVGDVFTSENLHSCYGGQLTILSSVAEAVRTGTARTKQDIQP